MAIDYKIQRNKLYTTLLSTKTEDGKFFLQKKWTFQNFYDRFFNTDQGVKDLFRALTTQKKENGQFFLNPEKYTLANFYYSFGCDLTFAPKEYCKVKQSKYSGEYFDRKAKLSITDVAGNLTYVLTMEKPYVIPVINKTIDPKIEGKLTSKVGDVYVDKKSWGEVKFNFIDDGAGNIELIEVEIIARGAKFTKKISSYKFRKTSTTSTEKPDTQEPEKETKKEPEKETKKTAQYDFTPWTCINNFNESWGYYKLLGGWDGVNKYAYEYTSHKVNGRKVKLLYFDNQKVVMRFEDDDSDVSGGTGKWECNTDGTGYTIRWDNGQIAVFNKTKGEVSKDSLPNTTPDEDSKDSKSPKSEGTSQLPKYKDVCKSTISCPNRKDVEAGKTSYKLCMKCPEIQEFQNNPVLKVIYFKKLKENGFKEKTDGVFGPITKAAVEEYQEMNGLVKDGLIGIKTLAQLDKDKSGRKE